MALSLMFWSTNTKKEWLCKELEWDNLVTAGLAKPHQMYSLHTILDMFPRHKSRMQSIHILSTSFNNYLLHSRRVLHCFAQMKPKTRLFQGCRTFSTGVEKPAFCRLYPVAVTATGFTYWKSRHHQNTIQPFSQVSIPSCRPGNWGNILIW